MKLIAIDVGNYSIKILESDISFRSVQLTNYIEIPFPISKTPPSNEEILKVLATISSKVNLTQCKISINLPSQLATNRLINLPFTDKRKIAQTLPFELEDQIPFDIDDIIIEHQIISKEGNNSKIFASILPIESLEKVLKEWKEIGIDPDLVTLGSVAMKNLTPLRFEDFTGIYAIINLGHTQTNITFIKEGALLLARTVPFGGLSISNELASVYKVDIDEAERAKIEQGFVLAGGELKVTQEQEKFSETIKNGINPLLKEIQQTFLFFKTEEKLSIDQVFITGGSSLIRNLNSYLQEELRVPVQQLKILETLSDSQIPITQKNEACLSQATSLILGGGGARRAEQLNFRHGVYAKVKKEGFLEPQFSYIAKAASIIIFLFMFNMIGKYIIYKLQYNRIEAQVAKTLTQSFPKIPKTVLDSPQRLKAFLEKELQRKEDQEEVIGTTTTREMTPLRVILELSKLTPEDLSVFISDLDIVNEKIKITGTVGSPEAAERLFSAYKNYSHFTKAEKKPVTKTKAGFGNQFTFEFDTTL